MNDVEVALIGGLVQKINEQFAHLHAVISDERHHNYVLNQPNAGDVIINPPTITVYPKDGTQGFFRQICSISIINNEIVLKIPKLSLPEEVNQTSFEVKGVGMVACVFGKQEVGQHVVPLEAPNGIEQVLGIIGQLNSDNIPSGFTQTSSSIMGLALSMLDTKDWPANGPSC